MIENKTEKEENAESLLISFCENCKVKFWYVRKAKNVFFCENFNFNDKKRKLHEGVIKNQNEYGFGSD